MENKISAGTISRTIILALALINQVLTAAGKSPIPIEDDTIAFMISTVWTVIASLVAFWKNNSFTTAAIEADKVLHEIKNSEDHQV